MKAIRRHINTQMTEAQVQCLTAASWVHGQVQTEFIQKQRTHFILSIIFDITLSDDHRKRSQCKTAALQVWLTFTIVTSLTPSDTVQAFLRED